MCIICLKPAGVDLPSDEEIKHMFTRNPHGAGFALQGDIHNDGRFLVEYHKGFMNVDDLLEALGPREKLKDLTVAIHCRIKTSGETDKSTTHPFPISSIYGDMKKLDGSGAVLFHNGIFSGLGGIIDPKSSDTQDFVAGIATRYLKNAKMPNKIAQTIVGKIAGDCRVLVMYPKRTFPILRLGTWYEHKGCYYSNTGYKDETYSSSYYGGYGSYRSSHYHRKTDSSNYRREIDQWGCNVAEYAWPSEDDDWIRFSDDRWENLKRAIKDKEEKGGETFVTFTCTGKKQWILDEDYKEIYTPAERETAKLRQDEEEYIAEQEEDALIYREDGYIWFEDEETMLNWIEKCKPIGPYEYRFNGETWLIDTDNLEAYTEEGIKTYFKSGEVGHVRKSLRETGSYLEHAKSTKFIYDDDEDDVRGLLPMPVDDDYEEELETLRYGRS